MSDKFSKETRSKVMSKIRSKNTFGERILKSALKGTYFRQHPKISGNPDFGNKTLKITIFVDGCFWHKCPRCYIEPKSNKKYWLQKIEKNVARDKTINRLLKKDGWVVIRIWEHKLKSNLNQYVAKIKQQIEKKGAKQS